MIEPNVESEVVSMGGDARLRSEAATAQPRSRITDDGSRRLPHSSLSTLHSPLPELLAPAGDWDCARAAVENGADAIYFGLDRFNARMRAANFTEADLPALMAYLHRRGVRGYVSFNTLVFADELADAGVFLRSCIAAGVDAAIVQDVGICRLIRRLSPDFPIHASTQMTITSAAGVAFARDLGCQLVVMARECTLEDIARIQSAQSGTLAVPPSAATGFRPLSETDHGPRSTAPVAPLPLEVFVHGALCVAYSGQCLTSEALGGRSANRGECAQACRLPYTLVADGREVPLGDRRYLLSPQDLAGLDVLPELLAVGVRSLKIEGRLKSPEYVANITRIYRQALDGLKEQRTASGERGRLAGPVADPKAESEPWNYEMQMAFSRGLDTGWFRGIDNQRLVHARFGKKRGVFLGEVRRVEWDRVVLRLPGPVKPGDGIVFDAGHPDRPEEGGRVYTVESRGGDTWLGFGRGDIDFRRVHVGDRVWKTSDPELDRRLRQTFAGDTPRFQRPLDLEVHGQLGTPLTVIARDRLGHVVQVQSAMPLMAAQRQPLTTERLRAQLGRLGGTAFRLAVVDDRLTPSLILPVAELNRLRREVVTRLDAQRSEPQRWTLSPPESTPLRYRFTAPEHGHEASTPAADTPSPELIVLVRSLPQIEAALAAGVTTLYCEFENPKHYRDAVSRVRSVHSPLSTLRSQLFVAPPRITKPGEEWMLKQVRSCDADGYLVRNYDHLDFFAGDRCVGDFSLNVANPLTAKYFKERYALERLTASYDLNSHQIEALLSAAPPEWIEITIHQHMPMFHMEHCIFCAFLTTGTDYSNCGRPCDRRVVRLRDRVGAEHPVKADAGCRNTVFNALAQTGAEYVRRLQLLGARWFRLEFVDETPEVVTRTIGMYRRMVNGEITGARLWRELKLRHQLGVTRGSLDKGERPITVL